MIIKRRERPMKIKGYEALLTRMPEYHAKREVIQDLLYSANAGIGGEERLDECLKYFDPPYPCLIIQDLSLPEKCQIDTLVITQQAIIILEVKNMSGKLRLQENPSALIQTLPSGQVKSYKSPVVQMETAKIRVEKIVNQYNFALPIKTSLVLAYPSQFIENVPSHVTVWSADEVLYRLYRMNYSNPLITIDEMDRLGKHLLSVSKPHNPFPLIPNLKISPDTINKGMLCPKCHNQKMKRLKRHWHCPYCKLSSYDAHLQALDEWFMLFQPTISTEECMEYLGLQNTLSASRILKKMDLEQSGGKKFRQYHLKENHRFQ